jgi:hypothetical protein
VRLQGPPIDQVSCGASKELSSNSFTEARGLIVLCGKLMRHYMQGIDRLRAFNDEDVRHFLMRCPSSAYWLPRKKMFIVMGSAGIV